MTEQEFLASNDPTAMLQHFDADAPPRHPWRRPPSDRKLRLFACACVRRIWAPMGRACARSVQLAEAIADGAEPGGGADLLSWHVLHHDAASAARLVLGDEQASRGRPEQAALLREIVGNPYRPVTLPQVPDGGPPAEAMSPVGLVRRRPGSPRLYERATCCPWLTQQVLSLAQAAYDERQENGALDPLRLAILADALEEEGCEDDGILQHLRGPACDFCGGSGRTLSVEAIRPDGRTEGAREVDCMACGGSGRGDKVTHARGCWALDLILGKE